MSQFSRRTSGECQHGRKSSLRHLLTKGPRIAASAPGPGTEHPLLSEEKALTHLSLAMKTAHQCQTVNRRCRQLVTKPQLPPKSLQKTRKTSMSTCPTFGSEAGPGWSSSCPVKFLSVVLDTAPILAEASARRRSRLAWPRTAQCRRGDFCRLGANERDSVLCRVEPSFSGLFMSQDGGRFGWKKPRTRGSH